MKKNISKTESVYFDQDDNYFVETNNKYNIGDDDNRGGTVRRIEPLDYNKNYDK